ncbi:MAG: hypothetical protein HZC47_07105 [Methanobacterium sp.]|uniref:hypothetical protein n=1 Tax=Methanobacterium sp. TaxID=2164 RepID=UPI003D65068B|nr:hypothetical protein [Methanobacterium sp.]
MFEIKNQLNKFLVGFILLLFVFLVTGSGCIFSSSVMKEGEYNNSVYLVKIDYPGTWSGQLKYYLLNGSSESNEAISISGSNGKTFSILKSVTGLKVSATKTDNGNSPLNITIWKNGQVIASNATSEVGGSVILKIGTYEEMKNSDSSF